MNNGHCCPICSDYSRRRDLLQVKKSSLLPCVNRGSSHTYGSIGITQCEACGHIYNRLFDPKKYDSIYTSSQTTNTVVSSQMATYLEATAKYIYQYTKTPFPMVLEIGGGTGALARILTERSQEVYLVDPSTNENLPENIPGNLVVYKKFFPCTEIQDKKFDLIVLRQVVEHILDVKSLFFSLRSHLAENGTIYLEIPSMDYIARYGSIVDFHYPHVHYFSYSVINRLIFNSGFEIIDFEEIKHGHDFRFMLQKAAIPLEPQRMTHSLQLADYCRLKKVFAARQVSGEDTLDRLKTRLIALYGATANCQAFVGLYEPKLQNVVCVIDDTPSYNEMELCIGGKTVPIRSLPDESFANVDVIIITAYLHDSTIYTKLIRSGFKGDVYTLRSDVERSLDLIAFFS